MKLNNQPLLIPGVFSRIENIQGSNVNKEGLSLQDTELANRQKSILLIQREKKSYPDNTSVEDTAEYSSEDEEPIPLKSRHHQTAKSNKPILKRQCRPISSSPFNSKKKYRVDQNKVTISKKAYEGLREEMELYKKEISSLKKKINNEKLTSKNLRTKLKEESEKLLMSEDGYKKKLQQIEISINTLKNTNLKLVERSDKLSRLNDEMDIKNQEISNLKKKIKQTMEFLINMMSETFIEGNTAAKRRLRRKNVIKIVQKKIVQYFHVEWEMLQQNDLGNKFKALVNKILEHTSENSPNNNTDSEEEFERKVKSRSSIPSSSKKRHVDMRAPEHEVAYTISSDQLSRTRNSDIQYFDKENHYPKDLPSLGVARINIKHLSPEEKKGSIFEKERVFEEEKYTSNVHRSANHEKDYFTRETKHTAGFDEQMRQTPATGNLQNRFIDVLSEASANNQYFERPLSNTAGKQQDSDEAQQKHFYSLEKDHRSKDGAFNLRKENEEIRHPNVSNFDTNGLKDQQKLDNDYLAKRLHQVFKKEEVFTPKKSPKLEDSVVLRSSSKTKKTENILRALKSGLEPGEYSSTEAIYAMAKYNYTAERKKDLSLSKGDRLRVIDKKRGGWWLAEQLESGEIGYVPSNYLLIVEK